MRPLAIAVSCTQSTVVTTALLMLLLLQSFNGEAAENPPTTSSSQLQQQQSPSSPPVTPAVVLPSPPTLVPFEKLPESFRNDKLPNQANESTIGQQCHVHIGCYVNLPSDNASPDPTKLKTVFHIRTWQSQKEVPFEPVKNCLISNETKCAIYPFNLRSLHDSPFNFSQRIIIAVSGFKSRHSSWEASIGKLWFVLENVNFISIDWSDANQDPYWTAAANTRAIGRQLTVLLYYLAAVRGHSISEPKFGEKIYVIGHSIGAHIAAFTGQDFGGSLGRITGLDPAGPIFDMLDAKFRLDPSDAQLVDTLITNGGASTDDQKLGTSKQLGHLNYYANDGQHQPGCRTAGCNHNRARLYYSQFLIHDMGIRIKMAEYGNKPPSKEKRREHRFHAFASRNFESFRDGSSLMQNCPSMFASETYFHSNFRNEMSACVAPFDYYAPSEEFREELRSKHNVKVARENVHNFKYYFYADGNSQQALLATNYLLRIRVAANTESEKEGLTDLPASTNMTTPVGFSGSEIARLKCKLVVLAQMKDSSISKYEFESYGLIGHHDHFNLALPIASSASLVEEFKTVKDKKSIFAKPNELRDSLISLLPVALFLSSSPTSSESANASTSPNTAVNSQAAVDGNTTAAVSNATPVVDKCQLKLDFVSVQPLVSLNQQIVAIYADTLNKPSNGSNLIEIASADKSADPNSPTHLSSKSTRMAPRRFLVQRPQAETGSSGEK